MLIVAGTLIVAKDIAFSSVNFSFPGRDIYFYLAMESPRMLRFFHFSQLTGRHLVLFTPSRIFIILPIRANAQVPTFLFKLDDGSAWSIYR